MTVLARRLVLALVLTIALATGCGHDGAGVKVSAATGAADLSYVIPAGTGARLDRGEPVEILPADLHVRVGQIIRIENDDDRGHLVGPFFVGAGETSTQQFRTPGVLVGGCSVHPSGTLTLTVEP